MVGGVARIAATSATSWPFLQANRSVVNGVGAGGVARLASINRAAKEPSADGGHHVGDGHFLLLVWLDRDPAGGWFTWYRWRDP